MNLFRLDPRIKLLLLIGLSTAALILSSPAALLTLLILAVVILFAGGIKPGMVWVRLRGLFGLLVMLFVIQCIFSRNGQPLLTVAGLALVTDVGFATAVSVSLRLLIIALGALIVLSGASRDYLLALTQCKIPYEIAFMVLAALRFLPIARSEAQDVLCAAQLRGLRIKKTGLKNKAGAYISITIPVIAGAIRRAEQMSIAMEARAFRALPRRTSMRRLRFCAADLVYAAVFLAALTAIFVFL